MSDLLYPTSIPYKPREYKIPTLEAPNSSIAYQEIKTDQVIQTLISIFPWLIYPICNNFVLAGGSIASIIQLLSINKTPLINDINDLDLFMIDSNNSVNRIETMITELKTIYPKCSLIRTSYAITLSDDTHKIQIILATYKSPFEVLDSFDLGASKVGIYLTASEPQFITTT
jgi:hypothetical protein